ncbi:MAG: DUF459 domain-containing protein [Ilumatobacteraceae bacterium]
MAAPSHSDQRRPADGTDGRRAAGHAASGPARRRPTPQQYRRRQAVAFVLLVVLVVGLVFGGRVAFGGDSSSAAETPTIVADTVGAATTVAGGDPAVTDPASSSPATPVSVPDAAVGVPSADNPVRMYIAGDSDAGAFAPYLQTLMKKTGMVDVTLDYKVSSGLARPDFYDWPARFAEEIPKVNPGIVVVTFGGNDAQGLADRSGKFVVDQPTGADGGDAAWREEYGKRVGEVMDLLTQGGRTLIWVGIPNDDNPDVTARMAVQDQVVRDQVAKHPGVVFVDTWQMFSGRNGGWADFVIDPRDGQGKPVRAKDGFHLNTEGAEILALKIADAITADLKARGAAL